MYFTWIGSFIVNLVQFLFSKFAFKKYAYVVTIPMYLFYITLIFTSWTLFLAAVIHIVNSTFDLLNMINTQNTSNGTPIFKCFFYLLNALGVSSGLKTGIALIVSDLLVVITLKASFAFKSTTQDLIETTNKILLK